MEFDHESNRQEVREAMLTLDRLEHLAKSMSLRRTLDKILDLRRAIIAEIYGHDVAGTEDGRRYQTR